MVVLETKALKTLKEQIQNSKELTKQERKNFLNFMWYLNKDERNYLKLLL